MDLKMGVEDVKRSRTFRCVLATVLTIGNFLNGAQVGYQQQVDVCVFNWTLRSK